MSRCLPMLIALIAGLSTLSAQQIVDAVDVQTLMPEPNGVQAKATAVVDAKSGSITEIKIELPGAGYGFVPRVLVAAPMEAGTTPILEEAAVKAGQIIEIKVLKGGAGYRPEFPPEVWIESPNRRAEARAVLSPDTLTHVEIIDPGSGYVPPTKARNSILGAQSWSGGLRVWINDVTGDGFASGHSVKVVSPDGAEKGRGTIGNVGQFAKGAPEGSDSCMVNLVGFKGVAAKNDLLEFAGYTIKLTPARNATAHIMADVIADFGFGIAGTRIRVENGGGFSTLRGLPPPAEPRAAVRALGYYAPGDGGGGVFRWNPERKFAMPRSIRVRKGGEDYRPGDVVLLNNLQRFLVWDVRKKASATFPDGVYRDHLGLAASGVIDVGAITELIPVEHRSFGDLPKNQTWSNSKATWSAAKEGAEEDGPGSGKLFVKGGGDIDISVVWSNDNGGSILAPCGHTGAGRWDRLYESDRNDIRFYGAVSDANRAGSGGGSATDNSWSIQMAIVSCGSPLDPAAGLHVWIPTMRGGGDSYLTGPLNINYGVDVKGNGGQLLGKPGQDILSTIIPPIDFPFNKNNMRDRVFEGLTMVVDESVDPTSPPGVAASDGWRARRLYKAMRWDKERNSQRFGALTFVEAAPVTDRRYFGTDDGLDPEEAPPINDAEPARRVYYALQPKEFSDYVVEIAVDPTRRGCVKTGNLTLEGGVPLFGSKIGPGKPGDRGNFGHPDAGKAVAKVETLFVPEQSMLSHKKDSGLVTIDGSSRTPLLKGSRYHFALKGVMLDDASKPGPGGEAILTATCVSTADGSLALSLTGATPSADFTKAKPRWIAGPAGTVKLVNRGSYKYKPGDPRASPGGPAPAFNERGKLRTAGEAAAEAKTGAQDTNSALVVDARFASENPVHGALTVKAIRGQGDADVIPLDAASPLSNGKDYYPWRIVKVATIDGGVYEPNLDYQALVDSRGQKLIINWRGAWSGKSPSATTPTGEYAVELQHFAGSPRHENLPYPAWSRLTLSNSSRWFADAAFPSASGGRISSRGTDGLVAAPTFSEGKDYRIDYDPVSGTGIVRWTATPPKNDGTLYLQYRAWVDDYDMTPWGSPKHLSGVLNDTVLVDAQERFMGNFAWIDQTINFPGYPPALGMGGMNVTFKDLRIYNKGARQSTSGGIHIWANYDGNHENIQVQDTNYGFVMPVNLYYPWQDYGVRPDGSTLNTAPAKESDVAYGDAGWGGGGAPDFLPNRYQSLLPYTGGSEQSVFKDFQFRCGDVGLFVVDSMFYEMRNIWASGANSVDRPRGSVMVFGTPANGVEQFSCAGQFGPLCAMFGEQALNGDYPLPTIRCCACGGHEVDFSGVTQGRQTIWKGESNGRAAGGRSTVLLGGNWEYSMGVWSPTRIRISMKKGSRTFAVTGSGAGADGMTIPPLRNGATYHLVIQDTEGYGRRCLQTSFTYDASKPIDKQTLKDAVDFDAVDVSARVANAVIRKKDFSPVELEKIRRHYAWSLMLCGDQNEVRVSSQALKDRKRLIIENGGRNKISSGPFDE